MSGTMQGLPVPPVDYEKEPLVTSSINLNTDNLRRAVRWLVSCVQDQQQTLVRHGRRLEDMQQMSNAVSLEKQNFPENEGDIIKNFHTDGFRNTLNGELLDIKINAVNRQLKVELPRMCDFEIERSRMMADVAALQRDLTNRFQEADQKLQSDLGQATSKLFDQLSRISSDVISRIDTLESRVRDSESAVKDFSAIPSSSGQSKDNDIQPSQHDLPFPAESCKPETASEEGQTVEGHSSQMSPKSTSSDNYSEVPLDEGRKLVSAASGETGLETPSVSRPDSRNTASRPGTTGTMGAGSIEEEGSVASTNDSEGSRKQPWNPVMLHGKSALASSVPSEIGSLDEVQKIAEAQHQALAEARNDLDGIAQALQAESEQRIKAQNEIHALNSCVMTLEGTIDDLRNELADLRRCQPMKQDSKDHTSRVLPAVSEASEQKAGSASAPADMAALPDQSGGEAGAAVSTEQFTDECQQEAQTDGPSLKDMVHGTVTKITRGKRSNGVQDENAADVKKAFMAEARSWLNDEPVRRHDKSSISYKPQSGHRATGSTSPPGTNAGEASRQADDEARSNSNSSPYSTKEMLTDTVEELRDRVKKLEGIAPQSESSFTTRLKALEEKFDVIQQLSSANDLDLAISPRPAGVSEPPDANARSAASERQGSKQVLLTRLFQLEERVGNIETDAEKAGNQASSSSTAGDTSPEKAVAPGSEKELKRLKSQLADMIAESSEASRGECGKLSAAMQQVQQDVKLCTDSINEILSRLYNVESRAASAPDMSQASPSASSGAHPHRPKTPEPTPQVPTLQLESAVMRPGDFSHLLDPSASGGQTPLNFVSKRGLQQAVEGLTENFRSWLDAIHQSIITALQNKADSSQLELIARQVQDAAGRASDSVASFAKRALGGRCASCDMPLPDESLQWKKPAVCTSNCRWMPKASGAVNAIRAPGSSPVQTRSSPRSSPVPACGASRLPKLQDLRQHELGEPRVQRDFPKGKVLRSSSSDPQMRILRQSIF